MPLPARRPLDPALLAAALRDRDLPWQDVRVLATTGSTNADATAAARADAATGWAVAADEQTAGRGRSGRSWASPAGGSLSLSVVLRPDVPDPAWGWLPLLVGVAATDALAAEAGLEGMLKWPNDVVVDGPDRDGGPGPRKLGGILVERITLAAGSAAVAGVGINVDLQPAELPTPAATSLALEAGTAPPREQLLAALLAALHRRYADWVSHRGDATASGLAAAYRQRCVTLGRDVRIELPGRAALSGTAVDVDGGGRLRVRDRSGVVTAYSSGEVTHVRAGGAR